MPLTAFLQKELGDIRNNPQSLLCRAVIQPRPPYTGEQTVRMRKGSLAERL